METAPETLYHRENLGPCRTTVTVTKVRWRSGELRFALSETFTPTAGNVGSIQVVDTFTSGEEAVSHARRLADEWQRSSARAELLAPGGRLRELAGRPVRPLPS